MYFADFSLLTSTTHITGGTLFGDLSSDGRVLVFIYRNIIIHSSIAALERTDGPRHGPRLAVEAMKFEVKSLQLEDSESENIDFVDHESVMRARGDENSNATRRNVE